MRLDKLLGSQTDLSRKEARQVIKDGLVQVGDEVIRNPGFSVDPNAQSVTVAGTPLDFKEHLYLMLNKPAGYISATEDRSQKTVLDLVPPELYRDGLFPAGRLDADTTGFVLLTDDGAFAHEILSPKHHVQKTYIATLAEPVTEECLQKVRGGIELKDGTVCLPADVRALSEFEAELKLVEGKYHQVKRMFAAAGNRVVALRRTAIGDVALDPSLAPGECRELCQEELSILKNRKN